MKLLIIDGQGGKLGHRLVEEIRKAQPDADITAVGTNTAATESMIKAGATRGATGENAVVVACRKAEVIIGPLGIVLADAMHGEITPKMANAVAASPARRILVPMNLCDTYIAGVSGSTSQLVSDAINSLSRMKDSGN